jgi:predicted site-specific integrase-resolvase
MQTLVIGNGRYVSAATLMETCGISRQTLWRWRQEGSIPPGSMHRNRVVFTEAEAKQVKAFADRLVPLETRSSKEPKRRRA